MTRMVLSCDKISVILDINAMNPISYACALVNFDFWALQLMNDYLFDYTITYATI